MKKSFEITDDWNDTIEVEEMSLHIDINIKDENVSLSKNQANDLCQQLEDMLGRNEE